MTKRKPAPEVAAEPEILPPFNLHSERVILGAIVEDEKLLPEVVAAGLLSADFYLETHQRIFAAMLALRHDNAPVDVFTVLDKIGNGERDRELLFDLVNGVVIERSHILYHCSLVQKKSRLRKLAALADWITKETYELAADPAVIVASTVQRAGVLA